METFLGILFFACVLRLMKEMWDEVTFLED